VTAKQLPIIVINGLLALLALYYISIQVPVAGLLIGALMPLPTILTIRRGGWLAGLLLVAAGLGMMYYVEHFSGLKAEVLPFLHMALIGFGVAFFASRQYPLEVVVGSTVLLAVAAQVGVFLALAWQEGLAPLAYLQRTVEEIWTAFSRLVENEPILKQEFELSGLKLADIAATLAQVIPALLLINNTLVVLLNFLLSRYMGASQGWEDPKLPLACWEAPGWLIFVLIGAGFLLLVPSQIAAMIGVNVIMICCLIYFFQGLAILAFSFRRFQVPRFLRWSAYLLLLVVKPAMLLVIIMGLIDLWLDFRCLHRPPPEE
jgi:uncharacterized protein YybS (DUF2232 family)